MDYHKGGRYLDGQIMIESITTQDCEKWDDIVRSMNNYDVYYLSGYVKAFEINGDGRALLVYMHNDHVRAIHVLMVRDVAKALQFQGILEENKYFDAATPYGYGGILVDGDDIDDLLKEYQDWCIKSNIICEFVRFHPVLQNVEKVQKYYDVVPLGDTVCLNTTSKEVVWKNIISKNRNMIRKAIKNGIQVYWGRAPWMIDTFMEIYNKTMDKDAADKYYYFGKEFYESILLDLKQEAMWFYALLDGKVIAMSIFLFADGKMHYHLSGSIKEYQNLAPTNLLLYEAAVWASTHGYSTLHLGGGVGASRDSLYAFKKAFNREEDKHFAIGKKIYISEKYEELLALRQKVDFGFSGQSSFFPKYRS